MTTVIKDVVTWLKQWFYTESEVDTITGGLQTQINNKADSTTVSALSTTVGNKADKSNGANQITDNNSANYTNIGTLSAGATQQTINNAINTKIGTLMEADWIVIVSTLPTASASTMGKLYLVPITGASGDNNFSEYITVEDSGSYDWEKLGEISGSGLSVDWADITGKPSTFTPSSHSHGNISNDGRVATMDNPTNMKGIVGTNNTFQTARYTSILTSFIKDTSAYTNIGSSANDSQSDINTAIDTALGGKASSTHNHSITDVTGLSTTLNNKANNSSALGTTITLVDKGETNEGCIIFNTIS